jgi:hypothetical protein
MQRYSEQIKAIVAPPVLKKEKNGTAGGNLYS